MGKPATAADPKPRPDIVTALRLLSAVLSIVAVLKELLRPAEERTWRGSLGGVVPYDMRMPTLERTKSTLWDPDGPIVTTRVFGVGWSINFGAIAARLRSLSSTS